MTKIPKELKPIDEQLYKYLIERSEREAKKNAECEKENGKQLPLNLDLNLECDLF